MYKLSNVRPYAKYRGRAAIWALYHAARHMFGTNPGPGPGGRFSPEAYIGSIGDQDSNKPEGVHQAIFNFHRCITDPLCL